MSQPVRVESFSGIKLWTVDRPSARNAMSTEVAGLLDAAVDEVERDRSIRAVILTGAGNSAFVSGADLKFLHGAEPAARAAMDAAMLALLRRVEALDLPVIAALNGAVVGGGMEVMLACDMRIAEPHVQLTFKHAAMGVTPGWGGFARLAACVGRGTAARLLLTAQSISAEDALRVQLVDEIARDKSARERALELAQAICQTSPGTVRELKRTLRRAYAGPLTLDEEQRVFLESTRSADHREALTAFFAKRAPKFEER